jgi:hypothetical protein
MRKADVKVLYFILIMVNKLTCVSIYWHNFTSLLIQIDPFFPFGTGTVQVCDLAVFHKRTFAILKIMPINKYILLYSATIADFPTVAIPELTGCTNFPHPGTAENIG